MKTRKEKILELCNTKGRGLEIGASGRSVVPKSGGFNVEILDYTDKEGLIKKWEIIKRMNSDNIEDVDYIWNGGSYVDTIGKTEHYDYIIASHVLEHSVCIISFLQDCMQLLKSGGILSIVLPDTRTVTLNRYQSLSSVGDAVSRYCEPNRQRHDVGTVIDNLLNSVSLSDNGEDLKYEPSQVKDIVDAYIASDEYVDVHNWAFTKSSFELFIYDLLSLGYIECLQIAKPIETGPGEFYISLRKTEETVINAPRKGERHELLGNMKKEIRDDYAVNEKIIALLESFPINARYIYGAGSMGSLTAKLLEEKNIEFNGFIVSDGQEKSDTHMGYPVYFQSQVDFRITDAVVIVGLYAIYWEQVKPLLDENPPKEIIALF
jgi:predicted SAM-dependent methyltransferase